jgi:hypothetical protein
MIVPAILFALSVLALAATWTMPDAFLLAVLCALASAIVLLRAWYAPDKKAQRRKITQQYKKAPSRKITREKWIVIDGSNVMYWNGGQPNLETVIVVIERLTNLGFVPGVMFDANAGYLLGGRHRNDVAMARDLGLPRDRVMVVAKGVQADGFILQSARDLQARIVTNDRFRDWQDAFPEVASTGYLVQGGYREGRLWLDLDF